MKAVLSSIALVAGLLAAVGELRAEDSMHTAEERIRKAARAIAAVDYDVDTRRFCQAWRQLKPGMSFHEAETLGIEMNGSCTPGKPQSFHQPYMDLYFDAECGALHGATTLDC